ncbi:MAG: glycosyltransferase family 4 protein [bacterium]
MLKLLLILMVFFSYVFVGIFRSYAIKKNLLDHPNSRSSHLIPVPRGGGVVFPVLWTVFLLILYFLGFVKASYLSIFLPPVFLICFISFIDDKYQLAARWRFLAQLGAAIYSLIAVGGFSSIDLGVVTIYWAWFGYIFMVLALLWSTNLYNFMDGIDGIAAIEALFVFGFGGYFIWCAGGFALAYVIWGIASIVAGFLMWNKPPAKIFMGDVGSTLLGFLVVLFGLVGEIWYRVPFLLWVILYGVFLFDATVTLFRRAKHGEIWYQAHRLHAYQRLQLQRWSHGKVVIGVIAINVILAGFAILAFYFPQYILISLVMAIITLSMGYIFIEKLQPMYLR